MVYHIEVRFTNGITTFAWKVRHIEPATSVLVKVRELILVWMEYVAEICNSDIDEGSTTFAKEEG